jgi:hypothetical protein
LLCKEELEVGYPQDTSTTLDIVGITLWFNVNFKISNLGRRLKEDKHGHLGVGPSIPSYIVDLCISLYSQ